MALNYLLSPEFQIVNTAGKPATGGYLEVYISGSRERYYCASDFDGTLYPFHVPLDSLGSNVVLADESNAYDVYVYNRYGSILMSRYNVRPRSGGGIGTGDITSSDGSIIVTQTANGVDLRTNSTPPSILRATAATLYADGQFVFSEAQRDGQNAIVDAQGKVIVNEGWWHYDATVRLCWNGPAQNETQSVSLYTQNASDSMTVDLSFAHSETVQVSGEYKALNDSTQFVLGVTGVPSGMIVELVDFGVHSIIGEGAGGKYNAGKGITIDEPNRIISIDPDVVQEKLTAGTGISIDENNVISVTEDVDNDFVTLSPVVAPPDGSGLFLQVGHGLQERVLDYMQYELPHVQVGGSEDEYTYHIISPWKLRRQGALNTDTTDSANSTICFFLASNVPSGLSNCVVQWSCDKNRSAYIRSKTLLVPTYSSTSRYVPCNSQQLKSNGYWFSIPLPKSVLPNVIQEDSRFDVGGDWSSYTGALPSMYFSLYNTVTNQYVSLPHTDGEKMAVRKEYNLQIDYTKVQPRLTAGSNITITDNVISATAEPQVQADWAQSDSSAVDYIKNKPANLVQDPSYVHTDNNFTNADVSKLAGIAVGAEVNVQSDWTEADTTADSYIQNKPAETSLTAGSNITITESGSTLTISATAAPQQQANWTEADSTSVQYIQNKPTPTSLVAGANISIVDDAQNNTVTIAASVPNVPVQDVTIDNVSVVNAQGVAEVPRQVNADWSSSAGASEILNKPTLATVATSGNYNDLSNLPSIPVIGTVTL